MAPLDSMTCDPSVAAASTANAVDSSPLLAQMAEMIEVATMRPRVALVTCREQPELFEEEGGLPGLLRARGIDARAVVWDDPDVDWRSFDVAFLRSVWDYFHRHSEFSAWLERAERATTVVNAPPLVRWNMNKLYLRELRERGVTIVPTVFCEQGDASDLAEIVMRNGWSQAVLKPAISGAADRTYRFHAKDASAHNADLAEILLRSAGLVQPFLPEILSEGEWSLFYFDGAFSHAVLKAPAAGDYRVQSLFGGTAVAVSPPPWMLEQARHILHALPSPPVYARLDGVRRGDAWLLMEAELIEPYLFTVPAPGALERYAALVEKTARATTRKA